MRVLRPLGGKLIRRLQTNVAVCRKGNETRMGKGKGPFDYWAVRVPTGKILFEMKAENLHEKVARDAFRVAADKLPGVYEMVRKGDVPKTGFKQLKEPKSEENIYEKMAAAPTRKYANILKSKAPELKAYIRR